MLCFIETCVRYYSELLFYIDPYVLWGKGNLTKVNAMAVSSAPCTEASALLHADFSASCTPYDQVTLCTLIPSYWKQCVDICFFFEYLPNVWTTRLNIVHNHHGVRYLYRSHSKHLFTVTAHQGLGQLILKTRIQKMHSRAQKWLAKNTAKKPGETVSERVVSFPQVGLPSLHNFSYKFTVCHFVPFPFVVMTPTISPHQ